jgi:hypothetical protein
MQIKKGNLNQLQFGPLRYWDRSLVTNLASVTDVRYLVKIDPDDDDSAALITKRMVGLAGVSIDTPSTGYITVTLAVTDTEILDTKEYYHGLQVEWPAGNIQEIWMKEDNKDSNIFDLKKDVVRKP